MEHITIILVSSDQEYGKALGLGLLHVCRSFMIRILNPQEILQDNERNSSDLIIWMENCRRKQIPCKAV